MRTTKIEWTERTWNPVTGCKKVSEGCRHCYAEMMSRRLFAMGNPKYSNNFISVPKQLVQPLAQLSRDTMFKLIPMFRLTKLPVMLKTSQFVLAVFQLVLKRSSLVELHLVQKYQMLLELVLVYVNQLKNFQVDLKIYVTFHLVKIFLVNF